jgi:hypothetical protein
MLLLKFSILLFLLLHFISFLLHSHDPRILCFHGISRKRNPQCLKIKILDACQSNPDMRGGASGRTHTVRTIQWRTFYHVSSVYPLAQKPFAQTVSSTSMIHRSETSITINDKRSLAHCHNLTLAPVPSPAITRLLLCHHVSCRSNGARTCAEFEMFHRILLALEI